MKEFRERRIMILMRVALFFAGGLIGALSMWQALDTVPFSFPVTVTVLCYVASVLFLGGLLALSAPPLRAGFHKFSGAVRKRFRSVKAVDVAGVAIGLLLGLGAAFLSEFLFGLFLNILALRVLIDASFGLLVAFLTTIAVSGSSAENQKEDTPAEIARGTKGYLLTERALANPKIISLCGLWLDGNIYVLSRTADKLAARAESPEGGGAAAFEHFKALYAAKKLRILEFLSNERGADAYFEAAEAKKLKIVAAETDEKLLAAKRSVVVLVIDRM